MFGTGLFVGLMLGLVCFYASYCIALYIVHKIEDKEEETNG